AELLQSSYDQKAAFDALMDQWYTFETLRQMPQPDAPTVAQLDDISSKTTASSTAFIATLRSMALVRSQIRLIGNKDVGEAADAILRCHTDLWDARHKDDHPLDLTEITNRLFDSEIALVGVTRDDLHLHPGGSFS